MAAIYKPVGDSSIIIEFENKISKEVNTKVRNICRAIEKNSIKGVEEVIPTYRSLLINYNPLEIEAFTLINQLKSIGTNIKKYEIEKPKIIEIPTLYGGEYGPDLNFVAQYNNLSVDEVIEIHSSKNYLVYMLGFTPGFPYLGGLSEKINAPRLKNPRPRILAGSVGIAGSQTGIYPVESPGGWRIIGRTPLKLFDPESYPYFLVQMGDYLRFVVIDQYEYKQIELEINAKQYKPKTYIMEEQTNGGS